MPQVGEEPVQVRVQGKVFTARRLAKLLWPEEGLTKAHLMEYLAGMAPYMLPYLRHRFLSFTQYPDGIYGRSFFRKNAPAHTPAWVATACHPASGGRRLIRYILCQDEATLLWLGSQAAIELHPWLSRADAPQVPEAAVVDLDPAQDADFRDAVTVALALREVLDRLGLRGYLKVTGSTGIHVYIPLAPRYTFREAAELVRLLGLVLLRLWPRRVTLERAVARRRGVYVDYLQNARGKTLIAPFCPRARPGAPVAFPVTWEDLPSVHPMDFTLRTAPALARQRGDPLAPALQDFQELEPALERLRSWVR